MGNCLTNNYVCKCCGAQIYMNKNKESQHQYKYQRQNRICTQCQKLSLYDRESLAYKSQKEFEKQKQKYLDKRRTAGSIPFSF